MSVPLNRFRLMATLAVGAAAAPASVPAPAAVVINEVYAGGGSSSSTAAFRTDFVELFNNGITPVDLAGHRLDYASSSRANGVFDIPIGTLPAGAVIQPLGTYLVQTGNAGTGGAPDVPPNADFEFVSGVSGAGLSNTAGSVRFSDAAGQILDLVGYGTLTNGNFETAPAAAPANATVSLQRVAGLDTNNNSVDFIQASPTPVAGVPEPSGLGLLAVAGFGLIRRRRGRAASGDKSIGLASQLAHDNVP